MWNLHLTRQSCDELCTELVSSHLTCEKKFILMKILLKKVLFIFFTELAYEPQKKIVWNHNECFLAIVCKLSSSFGKLI